MGMWSHGVSAAKLGKKFETVEECCLFLFVDWKKLTTFAAANVQNDL